jgi:hypothetical protein
VLPVTNTFFPSKRFMFFLLWLAVRWFSNQ